MKLLLIIWLALGTIVNIYYHVTKAEEYGRRIMSGELKPHHFILGGFLTIFFWPVAIYNNEIRKK